ncbi:MAG: dUTP diphosphatase [bacterium]
MKSKINELLEMQKDLDKAFMKEFGITYDDISYEQYAMAIIDEIGEFVHTRKPNWCWWSKKQQNAVVDEKHSLEEMVDILHFVLGVSLKNNIDIINEDVSKYEVYGTICNTSIEDLISLIVSGKDKECCLPNYLIFASKFGYDLDTLYEAYLEKNKENYRRIKEGY